MKLRFSHRASSDLYLILRCVLAESPSGAHSVARRFDEVFQTIKENPHLGRTTNRRGMRCVNAHPYPYLIFYKPSRTEVEVVAVRHGARNPKSMPARPR